MICAHCGGPIPAGARRDSVYCSKSCRQAAWDFRRMSGVLAAAALPMRLAYADPPYPGLSATYYADHPDYAGEVDHVALVGELLAFDGWALSTNSAGITVVVMALAYHDAPRWPVHPDGWRVASWHRGRRNARTAGPGQAWEPVFYKPARAGVVSKDWPDDALVYAARPRLTDPRRVIGAKSARFCAWMFGLIGARAGDSFDDRFPGSGGVGRAWAHASGAVRADVSEPGRTDASPPGWPDASVRSRPTGGDD